MKPLATFHIIPNLPERIAPLWDLGYNLWWTWNKEAIRILLQIDAQTWIASGRNPLSFLAALSQEKLEQVAQDEDICRRIAALDAQFKAYLSRPAWSEEHGGDAGLCIAYFSAEFGLAECFPIYSGGLGVLAGDHLKSASDLGLPLVGVGLLYQQGYFHQTLTPEGWQLELYPESDFDIMPIRQVERPSGEPLVVEVPYPDRPVRAQVWSAQVGRVSLYLLDTCIEDNHPEDHQITAQLYGGDQSMRIRQEILLGIGGLRALHALDIHPSLCHMNEGHSAFQALERIRMLMQRQQLSFAAAREATSAGNIFTTHTPVAAGNDWFPAELVEAYMGSYREELGLSSKEFLGLGRVDPDDENSDFCMTVLALRLSAQSNGVSRLHGEVSRKMWAGLWPGLEAEEIPITSVTNGIHSASWTSLEMSELFERYLGGRWRYEPENPAVWEALKDIPDGELWAIRQYRRRRLIDYARSHLNNQFARRGMPRVKIEGLLADLNPAALTIGFARRFATYKRANLIFRNLERLAALFADSERPIQLFFAGKAHPHDHPGKELIREIISFARQTPFSGRVFFLEDYDMNLARYLVQGCDAWLNNPHRPQEASGTSGMKAALNGVLNISVLDGWWIEACEVHSGWAIGRGEVYEDLEYQDQVESNALYDLLETEIIPLFYSRDPEGVPDAWVERIKETIRALAPRFNTNRMVREYIEGLYRPNQQRWRQLNDNIERVEKLSQWKERIRSHWPQVKIESIAADPPAQPRVGMRIPLEATVMLGRLSPADVKVELYVGKVDVHHEIRQAETVPLRYQHSNGEGKHLFAGEFSCRRSGSQGYTLRVVPNHPDLRDPLKMGLVLWA